MSNKRNPVGWFEIYVEDMGRAKKFYESVLAINMQPLPSPESPDCPPVEMLAFPMPAMSSNPDDDCAAELPGACGALAKMEGFGPGVGGTLVYFSCDDCATEESRVAAAGGSVVQPKFSIGEYGFIAMVQDTEGNIIGLHSIS